MNILTGAWLACRYFPVIYPVAPNIFSVTRASNLLQEHEYFNVRMACAWLVHWYFPVIHPVATNMKEHKIHYYIHVMTKCGKQIDHSTWDLSGLLSIVVTIMLYLGRLFEFKCISMFSICAVEPTQPASARKSMANGSEAIEAIGVIRSKKDQVGENSWQTRQIARGAFSRCTVEGTRNSLPLKEHGNSLPLKQHKITAVERTQNSLQLREHEILLPLKDHGGT
ncbi:hypothetical protein B0H14DRAFT_2571376 [Mycena olivaceomarginata]|nr:hypothetical protein B0H14DRAFT_2571376 [Mycena olivaceomarginata]